MCCSIPPGAWSVISVTVHSIFEQVPQAYGHVLRKHGLQTDTVTAGCQFPLVANNTEEAGIANLIFITHSNNRTILVTLVSHESYCYTFGHSNFSKGNRSFQLSLFYSAVIAGDVP